jgi:hypothetical protein
MGRSSRSESPDQHHCCRRRGGGVHIIKIGMWTDESRERMATFEKCAKRYPTDLTDEE